MTANPTPSVRLPGSLAPLGYRNYALYWIGFASANTGRWIELTGALWLVYELTQSPLLLGLVGIARAVPSIVLSPLGGVVADRFDPRRLLFITQIAGALASLILGVLVITGSLELWHIYLQMGVQAGIRAFDAAVRQTLFPQLVPRTLLSEAVTLTVTAGRSSKFVGPAVGGLTIAHLGLAAPFFLNAGTFGILMFAVIGMRNVTTHRRESESSMQHDLLEGLRHILAAPVLSGLLKLEIVFSLFQMNEVMITIIAREVLDAGPEGLGLLLSAPAIGSLLGIGGMLVVQPVRQGRFAVVCTYLYVATLVFVVVTPYFWITFGALVVVGLFDALVTVTRHSVMQLAAPEGMRGRVMANMNTVTQGVGPLAQAQSGALAGLLSAPLAVYASAVALGLAAAITARTNRSLWDFKRDVARVDRRPTADAD